MAKESMGIDHRSFGGRTDETIETIVVSVSCQHTPDTLGVVHGRKTL
jgi:hypothetical protein